MITMPFSYNWNKKLDCQAFTTIRLYNPGRHVPGNKVDITLKGSVIATGTLTAVKPFYLAELNPFISYLDTGYSVQECRNILMKMYPKADWKVQRIALILIVKDKKEEKTELATGNIFNQG